MKFELRVLGLCDLVKFECGVGWDLGELEERVGWSDKGFFGFGIEVCNEVEGFV